ncbi:hypothetical protein [Actinoplanes sp. L3-i22]|uniref:hypothetical protein n=1 Tax=Actinoplanes sp. L3-i22 TaxID=2836373 RepID=UPI001C75D6EE|nr:hypothetical protein L3i22_084690 [Actinoplanes sp. L3-i22]
MPAPSDYPTDPFAGELMLALADEGRLAVEAGQADAVIAGLERTLSEVRARLRVIRIWQQMPTGWVDELRDDLADEVSTAVLADQMAPGRLEQALVELPKYIEALRRARVPSGA